MLVFKFINRLRSRAAPAARDAREVPAAGEDVLDSANRRRIARGLSFARFALPTLVLILGLGFWQLERLEWKRDLIRTLEVRARTAPENLNRALERGGADTRFVPARADEWDFLPMTLVGRFVEAAPVFVAPRTLDGAAGAQVFHAFVADAGGGGVWVARGWVPFVGGEARVPAVAEPKRGRVVLMGVLRSTAVPRHPFAPKPPEDAARPEDGGLTEDGDTFFAWPFLEVFSKRLAQGEAPHLASAYLQLTDAPGRAGEADSGQGEAAGVVPVPQAASPRLRDEHATYARIWFTLAATLAALWLAYAVREPPAPKLSDPSRSA